MLIIQDINWATFGMIEAESDHVGCGDLVIVFNSHGGIPAAAIAAANTIKRRPGKTVGRVVTRCDSAGILPLAACDTRIASLSATFQCHETSPTDHAMDDRFRTMISRFIRCSADTIADLERSNARLTGIAALRLGLVTILTDMPHMTRQHDLRRAREAFESRQANNPANAAIREARTRVAGLPRVDGPLPPHLMEKLGRAIRSGQIRPRVFGLSRGRLAEMLERLPDVPPMTIQGIS